MALRPKNRKELLEWIESTEAGGEDATAARRELEALEPEVKRVPQTRRSSRVEEEEETTEERLARRVGDLFPKGIPYEKIKDYDRRFSQKELIEQCRKAGLSVSGDKKMLAAKLIAKGASGEVYIARDKIGYDEGEEVMSMEETVDLDKQKEWEGKPGEVTIPEAYLKGLRYEIVVFSSDLRGGSDFTFRCREYHQSDDGQWRFSGVIIDTSKLNAKGDVELARFTYHPEVVLVNIGFMVVPAPEDAET
jgi:hypothetical protein